MLRILRHRIHLSQREDGFTLVELVVAMVIMAGVLLALIAVQISAATTIVEARKREQATAIGNQAMEQLRAIPWTYLSIGLHSNFATASGGDPYLQSGGASIKLPGWSAARTLRKGTQSLSSPRPPLFTNTGSNKSVVTDAAVTNTQFTVRAYVTEPNIGGVNTLGLAVVVTWVKSDGTTAATVIESTAYRGTGCGNPDEAPYLATCQATFDGISSSGIVTTSVTATTTSDGTVPTTPVNLLYPTSDIFYSMSMRSASVGATGSGQQVTNVLAGAQFGGTQKDDDDPDTQPAVEGWVRGYANAVVRATDDSSQSVTPLHVASTSLQQSTTAENEWQLSDSGTQIDFSARSDFRRPVSATASSTTSCRTGIPAGAPCASVTMGNNTDLQQGSGYILMYVGSQIFRLSRRVSETTPPANNDQAWVARYTTTKSTNAAVGCNNAVSGAGCMAAGASRSLARFTMGTVVSGTWSGNAASDGIVVIEGHASCSGGANAGFSESVMVNRGSSQRTDVATMTRCGQVRYWNGTSYSSQVIGKDAFSGITTGTVTWSGSGYTVTASATVEGTASNETASSIDANCATDPCSIRAQTGDITITVTYVITGPGIDYTVYSVTKIEGPSAQVAYQEAPSEVA